MAGHKEDERFAHILSDPKLQQIKLKEQKSKVDKRFHSLIANSKSKQKCLIDKRGRPVTALSKGGLSRFYDLSDSEEEEDGTKKAIHCKGKKEKGILEGKNKEKKHEKANKIKNEQKERNIITKKSGGKEDDDEQIDEEQKMELDVSEEEEEEDETEEDEDEGEEEDEEEEADDDDDDDDETDSDDDDEDEEQDKSSSVRRKNKKSDIEPDYSRGIGNISSSDDDDDDDEEGDDSGEEGPAKGPVAAIHPWAEMIEKEVPVVEQSTRRLAICNMNWDYVTAQDLMMLCNSFKPQHGTVISVTIYPTEFGIERMKEEYQKGPKEIIQVKPNTAKSTTQTTTEVETEEIANAGPSKKRANKVIKEKQSTEKKEEKNSEIVRMYELNRLRYFFAVVECDSVETADQIYTNCDGMEFEKSGTKLDFRYIPDDETFDYELKSVATSLPASGTYKPPHFVNAAVSRTDVKLSWDRTSHQRLAVTQMDFRKVKNIDELEDQFQEYIAPYTSEEDDDEEGEEPYPDLDWSYIPGELPAKKDVQDMKNVLLELKEGEKEEDIEEAEEEEDQKSDEDEVHMEFSWDIGLKDSLEGAAKQKKKETENEKLTPWEQYQKSKKDKKRQKEREKKRKAKADQKKESDKVKETSVELDNFFLPDGSSDEEKEKPKRQKESLKKRAKKRKREAEEQRLEVDQSVLADPRFADLAKKDFALDPSAPEFRKRRRKF